MRLTIDNLDTAGPCNYTAFLGRGRGPRIRRKLNRPDELEFELTGEAGRMAVPAAGARVELVRADGTKIFTGYLAKAPQPNCLGMEERGAWISYTVHAVGDEFLLDRKPLSARPSYAAASCGALLRELAHELCPTAFDTSAMADGAVVPSVSCGGSRTWGEIAEELAANTRSAYRVHDRAVVFAPLGLTTHEIRERDIDPALLKIDSSGRVVNDAVLLGPNEPAAFVKDQFVGDGLSLAFSLSNYPYLRTPRTVVEEEFGGALADSRWKWTDVAGKLGSTAGKLSSNGGTGTASECCVALRQTIELGGAWQFQGGELTIGGGDGLIAGLFDGVVDPAHCIAAFRVRGQAIQPLVNGAAAGTAVSTRAGCRYALSTRVYATEPYRLRPAYFSAEHPAGNGLGGESLPADIRVVLECREIDPADPASLVQPAVVLYDDVIANAPATAVYVPLASESLTASINFVRVRRMPDVLVRTAEQGNPFRTRLVGALSEGAECTIGTSGSLYFYSMNPPKPNEAIEVSYRTSARAAGHASDAASAADLAGPLDDGVRGVVATLAAPAAKSSEDCALAAKAWLEDASRAGWSGEYLCWSEDLPGEASDVLPGDAVHVVAPSRAADFTAIVREVQVEVVDAESGREWVRVLFADDAAEPVALELGREQEGYEWPNAVAEAGGPGPLAAVNNAAITQLTSTTMTIDAGVVPQAGGGIEVRRSDAAWSPENDRNLAGRFTTRNFTLPRLARNQQYCLRQYDASVPPRYSRHTTILYVDKPL